MKNHQSAHEYLSFWDDTLKSYMAKTDDEKKVKQKILAIIHNRENSIATKAQTLTQNINTLLDIKHQTTSHWQPWLSFSFNFFGLLPKTFCFSFGGSSLRHLLFETVENEHFQPHHSKNRQTINSDSIIIVELKNISEITKPLDYILSLNESDKKALLTQELKALDSKQDSESLSNITYVILKNELLDQEATAENIAKACKFLVLIRDEIGEDNFQTYLKKLLSSAEPENQIQAYHYFINQLLQKKTNYDKVHNHSYVFEDGDELILTTLKDKLFTTPLTKNNIQANCLLLLTLRDSLEPQQLQQWLKTIFQSKHASAAFNEFTAFTEFTSTQYLNKNDYLIMNYIANHFVDTYLIPESSCPNQMVYKTLNALLFFLVQPKENTWKKTFTMPKNDLDNARHEIICQQFSCLPSKVYDKLVAILKNKMNEGAFKRQIEGSNGISNTGQSAYDNPINLFRDIQNHYPSPNNGVFYFILQRALSTILTTYRYLHNNDAQGRYGNENWKSSDIANDLIKLLLFYSNSSHDSHHHYHDILNLHAIPIQIKPLFNSHLPTEHLSIELILNFFNPNKSSELILKTITHCKEQHAHFDPKWLIELLTHHWSHLKKTYPKETNKHGEAIKSAMQNLGLIDEEKDNIESTSSFNTVGGIAFFPAEKVNIATQKQLTNPIASANI